MEELKQILTPQVVMVMMLTGTFTNVLIVGGMAWMTWLLAPSIKQFLLSFEKEMKKMNQAILDLIVRVVYHIDTLLRTDQNHPMMSAEYMAKSSATVL